MALVLLILLTPQDASAKDRDRLNVLFVNPGFSTGFWGSVTETMRASAEDLSIDLTVVDADRDRIKMIDLTEQAILSETPWDYAVIVNELQQGPQLAKMLDTAEIPYLFLLNRIDPDQMLILRREGHLTAYKGSITPRNFETGYMTAKALIEAVDSAQDRNIRVLALLGDTATPAAVEREAGMRRAVAEAQNVDIIRAFSVDWLFDRAKSAVALFLQKDSADIIWTASGPIAFGAMEAIEEAGLTPGEDIRFAGVGWFPNALNAVEQGRMTMTYGGYFISGAWSMVILRDIADGVIIENKGEVNAPLSAVDTTNIGAFQRTVNGIDWGTVDFSRFLLTQTRAHSYDFSTDRLFQEIGPLGN